MVDENPPPRVPGSEIDLDTGGTGGTTGVTVLKILLTHRGPSTRLVDVTKVSLQCPKILTLFGIRSTSLLGVKT